MKKGMEKKNKKMKKGKTLMILTIVMLVLLAGSIVHGNGMWPEISENEDGTITVAYENGESIEMSSTRFNAVKEILIGLEYPNFVQEGDPFTFSAKNHNAESDKELVEYYYAEITFDEKDQIQSQIYYEDYVYYEDDGEHKKRITEINQEGIAKAWIQLDYADESKPIVKEKLDEETIKLPTGIPLNEYIKAEDKQIEISNIVKDATGNTEVEIETEVVEESSVSPDVESAKKPHLVVPSDEISDAVGKEIEGVEIFNNQINFEGNTLTYTTKDANGNLIDVAISYNKDGTKESTTKRYGNNIIYFEEGKEKIKINHNLGIKTIDYDYEGGNYIATISDGSKGKLEDGNKFIYDSNEGVTHTLEALNGGGTLEFYNKNLEEKEEGTITITRGNIKIKFYGTFDGEEVKEKGKKILAIDENGNILTDFDKNGESQTTYYAYNVFNAYVFGRKQSDKSEKIYLLGYKPFAFRTSDGEVILIQKQKDKSYKYYTSHKGEWIELKEGDANFKEVNAMVRKTKIGPAFYAAARAARGGIALSNLLNSWLDIDFITNWRKKSDEFFSETVIGRIISGKWEESVCHSKIEKIPENIAVVNINNVMGFAAHVEGERSSAITTNNQTLYFYKITFGVNPSNVGDNKA